MNPFPPYQIAPQLFLSWPEPEFATSLLQILNQQKTYLNKWLTWVNQINTLNDAKRFLYEAQLFNKGGQKLITFILFKEQLIGSVAIVKIDKINQEGELGYWLHQDFQGQGIITKACKQLIDLAFSVIQLHRLIIKINIDNQKSLPIPERLGFQLEGILREATLLNGRYHDTKLFSLLKKDLV